MNWRLIKLISSLALIGAIATPLVALPASADPIISKDAESKIYIRGLTASSSIDLVFGNNTTTKSIVSNACGLLTIKGSTSAPLPSTLTVNGITNLIGY